MEVWVLDLGGHGLFFGWTGVPLYWDCIWFTCWLVVTTLLMSMADRYLYFYILIQIAKGSDLGASKSDLFDGGFCIYCFSGMSWWP